MINVLKSKLAALFLLICTLFLVACDQDESLISERSELFKKFYGTAFDEQSFDMEVLPDGDYLLVGETSSAGNGGTDIYLVRTDRFGDSRWQRTYGGESDDAGTNLSMDDQGNILVTGFITDDDNDRDYILLRLDLEGNILDSLTLGRQGFNEEGQRLLQTQDGGYVIGGNVTSGSRIIDNFFYKVSATGDSLWTVSVNFLEGLSSLANMVETDDGRILWCSTSESGQSNDDAIVVGVIASDGQSSELAFFGENNGVEERARDLQNTRLGWIVAGSIQESGEDSDMLLIGVNASGRTSFSWSVRAGTEINEVANSVTVGTNGNFIVIGDQEIGPDNEDILLAEVTFGGGLNWIRTFGGEGNDSGRTLVIVENDDILLLGTSEIENNDIVTMIRTDSEGEL